MLASCSYDFRTNTENLTGLELDKLYFYCSYTNVGDYYPENDSISEEVDAEVDLMTDQFWRHGWFRIIYFTVATYCILLPLIYLCRFVRTRRCFGGNPEPDFDNVLMMHRNGQEIDICRQLARIYNAE